MTEELTGRGILEQALARVYDEESAVLAREAANTPQPKLSETFTERMETLIRGTEERERLEHLQVLQARPSAGVVHPQMEELQPSRKTGWRRSKRAVRRLIVVAVLLAVMVPIGALGLHQSHAGFRLELEPDGRSYRVIYQTDNRGPSLKEFTTIKPKTPKGFHISNIFENDRDLIIEYIMDADSKKVIIFSQDYIGDNAQSMHIDAENDEEWYESIEGIRVFCSRKDDVLELFWVTENQSFDICANVDFTILRMMAEEVCDRLIY